MKNKRILVTGGAGFIGSHLTKRLVKLGNDVSVVVKYKSVIDNVRLSRIWHDINVIEADLRNIDSMRRFKGETYDIVFHLSAYNHVGDSFLHVNEALMSNAVGTANILECGPGFGRFVYTSTSEVYGYQESAPFEEEMNPNPVSPYAVGKYAGELYSRMKRRQTEKEIVCIRPFNVFGPYQSDRAIIPELIIKCLTGVPVDTTAGEQTREFNYVDNIIDGFLAAAEKLPAPAEIMNIGSQEEISIADLAQKIHKLCDSKSKLRIGALSYRPTEIWKMRSRSEKAERILGWKPKVPFDDGLKHTVEWYRKYLEVFHNGRSALNTL